MKWQVFVVSDVKMCDNDFTITRTKRQSGWGKQQSHNNEELKTKGISVQDMWQSFLIKSGKIYLRFQCTLEQVMKAYREGRGIVLLFL
jgi:hypothetical protein